MTTKPRLLEPGDRLHIKTQEYRPNEPVTKKNLAGNEYTTCYHNVEYDGVFQCFGLSYEEFDSGVGTYTAAIIMRDDGALETISPDCCYLIS